MYTREGSCVQLTEQEWDRRGCLRTARPMGPEALPSFLRSLWVKPRASVSTGSGWSTGHVLCSEPLWFLHDLLLLSKDSPCPHVRHPAFSPESVHDVRVRIFLLKAQGHSLPMRKCVLTCNPWAVLLVLHAGLLPAMQTDTSFYTLANT